MSKSQLYLLGLATLIGFPATGAGIVWFFEDEQSSFQFSLIAPLHLQLIYGILVGVLTGFIALGITYLPFMKPVREKYAHLIGQIDFQWPDIIFISFCAGVGEEYFFRGVLQYYWGIWPVAILFVALHGYLDPRNWRLSFYGVVLVGIIGAIGYLNDLVGLPASMIAHTVIDIILLYFITNNKPYANHN